MQKFKFNKKNSAEYLQHHEPNLLARQLGPMAIGTMRKDVLQREESF